MDFKKFDQRHYRTVLPAVGYGEWAESYEESVPNILDLGVLQKLGHIDWNKYKSCLDLACGTGRIGEWLRKEGVDTIDGIDLTQEMLQKAHSKNIYRNLVLGTVEKTGLKSQAYDLLVMSLVDEHLADLNDVYREASRLALPESLFLVVGMHPFFFMTGMPTHFKNKHGEPTAIETHIHLASDHIRAAMNAGWCLENFYEGVIDEEWISIKPKWQKYEGYPVNYGFVWKKRGSNE